MFDHVRVYGLTNRPAGYAQVPRGWDRVEERTPQFRHGTVRYDHALPLAELYSFEMTPVYRDEAEACEALLAAVAEQKQETLEQVKADLRDLLALYDAEADPSLPPSYPLHSLATGFQRETQVWPLGQYTAAELLPTMRELLRPASRAEVVPFRLAFDDAPRRPGRRAKRNGPPSQSFTGVVGGWAITMGGYQITVIDGEEYLTLFGGSGLRVRRGAVVEYEVGPVPEGWTLPYAKILRITGEVPMPTYPPTRSVRLGRRVYLVTRELAPGLRVLYEAWEPATVDKVSLRHHAVFSRSHGLVAGMGPDGVLGSALYESRDGGRATLIAGPTTSFWGRVTSRWSPERTPAHRAALEAEAVAAIEAAYGADWRAVESRTGGSVVAFDGPAAPRRAKPNSALAERAARPKAPGRRVPQHHPQQALIDHMVALVRGGTGGGYPLPILGEGSQRVVFALSETEVLKVELRPSRSEDNLHESAAEVDLWKTAPARDAQFLCPVLAAAPDGAWLVMARAVPVDPWARRDEARWAPLDRLSPADATENNVGWYRGRLVLIDYGR